LGEIEVGELALGKIVVGELALGEISQNHSTAKDGSRGNSYSKSN